MTNYFDIYEKIEQYEKLANEVNSIDWEYAGMNDPMQDLAAHSLENKFSEDKEELLLNIYFNKYNLFSMVYSFWSYFIREFSRFKIYNLLSMYNNWISYEFRRYKGDV